MVAGGLPDLFDHWDATSLKVAAPLEIVFVCGGTTDKSIPHDLTRRDALMSVCLVGEEHPPPWCSALEAGHALFLDRHIFTGDPALHVVGSLMVDAGDLIHRDETLIDAVGLEPAWQRICT